MYIYIIYIYIHSLPSSVSRLRRAQRRWRQLHESPRPRCRRCGRRWKGTGRRVSLRRPRRVGGRSRRSYSQVRIHPL